MQAKNGCSSKDTSSNSIQDGSTSGASYTNASAGSILTLKDVDGRFNSNHGCNEKGFTELDGLVQPKTISKTDQEPYRKRDHIIYRDDLLKQTQK